MPRPGTETFTAPRNSTIILTHQTRRSAALSTASDRRVQYLLSAGVTPGVPRRHVAQEFYANVLELGRFAREKYLEECKKKVRAFDQKEIDELDGHLATVEAELA